MQKMCSTGLCGAYSALHRSSSIIGAGEQATVLSGLSLDTVSDPNKSGLCAVIDK